MHLPALMRLLNRRGQARVEVHKQNIHADHVADALHHVRLGFLAGRYLSDYTDLLVHMDFPDAGVCSPRPRRKTNCSIQQHLHHLNAVLRQARSGEKPLTPATLPLRNQYSHVPGDVDNKRWRMADVAAFSCIHNCIQTACGGYVNGEKCRLGFPRKKMPVTVLGMVCANDDLSKRTSTTNAVRPGRQTQTSGRCSTGVLTTTFKPS
jgi:hypothetical protein